jgi:hypothetical protein
MAAHIYPGAKPNSIYAIAITLAVHGLAILFLINFRHVQFPSSESSIQMIPLKPEKVESVLIVNPPVIKFKPNIIDPIIPDINFTDIVQTDLKLIQSPLDIPYELPDPNASRYRNIFDPKVRQRLIDAQRLNKPRAPEKSTSWTEAAGRTFVDMGDGNCLVSMTKVDSRDRGTNWGHTRCGKTNSEKMMDNVTADLEARKHPLNLK